MISCSQFKHFRFKVCPSFYSSCDFSPILKTHTIGKRSGLCADFSIVRPRDFALIGRTEGLNKSGELI